jgi:hypothetical protein
MSFFAFFAFYCTSHSSSLVLFSLALVGTASQAHDECIDCQTTEERSPVDKSHYEQSNLCSKYQRFGLHADTTTMATNADQWKQHTFGLTDHIIRPN